MNATMSLKDHPDDPLIKYRAFNKDVFDDRKVMYLYIIVRSKYIGSCMWYI